MESPTPGQKPMMWTRWAVVVPTYDPPTVYTNLWYGLPRNERWAVRGIGMSDESVKIVIEYKARGANGNDITRTVEAACGVSADRVEYEKIASFNADYLINSDLEAAAGRAPIAVAASA